MNNKNNNNFNQNIKKILLISENIQNKIKNSKINKKNFLKKFEKIKLEGMESGNEIKTLITYPVPFDKPIKLEFKIEIDIDEVFLEQDESIGISLISNQNTISIDELVSNINVYMDYVNEYKPNIYQEFEIIINKENSKEIIFNNQNKFRIICWNLELKKYFCLLWIILEKLYAEFSEYKNNISFSNSDTFFKNFENELEEFNLQLKNQFNNFGSQINLIIILLLEIKKIFNQADIDKNILSFNTVIIILDKYDFIMNYIIENLTILQNIQN